MDKATRPQMFEKVAYAMSREMKEEVRRRGPPQWLLSEGRPLPALYENAAVYEFDKRFLGGFEVVVKGSKMRTCNCSMCHLSKF